MLTLYQKTYLGPIRNPEVAATKDLSIRELTTLAPLLAAIVILGVFPQPVLDMIKQPVADFVVRVAAPAGNTLERAPIPSPIRQVPFHPTAPSAVRPEGAHLVPVPMPQ